MRVLWMVVLLGCAERTATTQSAIIGGTPAPEETSTVLLAGYPPSRDGIVTCSAVVVAPTILFTAAHCIYPPDHPDFTFGVFLGADANPYVTVDELEPHLVPVAEIHPHPSFRPTRRTADLAAVILATPLDIAPVALQRAFIDDSIRGRVAHIVGYGQLDAEQWNASRHSGDTTVAALDGDGVLIGDATVRSCFGDSGGPAFVDGLLIGVSSTGPAGCDSAGRYSRIDYHHAFVDQFVPGPPRPDGPMMEPPPADGGCSSTRGAGWLSALGVLWIAAWLSAWAQALACPGARSASASQREIRSSSSRSPRRWWSTRS